MKRRYRSSSTEKDVQFKNYFNHPFEKGNNMKLLDDIYLDKTLSVDSLKVASSGFTAFNPNKEAEENRLSILNDFKNKNKKLMEIAETIDSNEFNTGLLKENIDDDEDMIIEPDHNKPIKF